MSDAKTIEVQVQQPKDAKQALEVLDRSITPLDLLQRAVQSNTNVDVMEKLLGLQERWERNEARRAFDAAIAKAKSEIPVIRKGNQVDFTTSRGRTNYSYEDLATIAQTIDPILGKYGLSYRWRPNSDSKSVTVTCILSHAAGHFEENTLYAPHDATGNKNAIQAVGSAVTYLQRYTLKAALGLAAAADDDARAVSEKRNDPPTSQHEQRQDPPRAAPVTTKAPAPQAGAEQTFPAVTVLTVKEVHSKPDAPKKWTAYFIKFSDGFAELEAATFDAKVADLANELANTNENATLRTKPGRKEGTNEIVSLTRNGGPPSDGGDQVPMSFDSDGNATDDVPH